MRLRARARFGEGDFPIKSHAPAGAVRFGTGDSPAPPRAPALPRGQEKNARTRARTRESPRNSREVRTECAGKRGGRAAPAAPRLPPPSPSCLEGSVPHVGREEPLLPAAPPRPAPPRHARATARPWQRPPPCRRRRRRRRSRTCSTRSTSATRRASAMSPSAGDGTHSSASPCTGATAHGGGPRAWRRPPALAPRAADGRSPLPSPARSTAHAEPARLATGSPRC